MLREMEFELSWMKFASENIQKNVCRESQEKLHDFPPKLSLLCFQTSNEPSAPSCDLLDLSPIVPTTPMANGEALNTVNSQLSALSK